MFDTLQPRFESSVNSWPQIEPVVARFRSAWDKAGSAPDIADYLADGRDRQPLLVELVCIDLQCRLERGQRIKVENYLNVYPDLQANQAALLALVRHEYDVKRQIDPRLPINEYLQRFPDLGPALMGEIDSSATKAGSTMGSDAVKGTIVDPERTAPSSNDSPPTAALSGLERMAASSARLPTVPGYELLAELGHGGMGVVYKARHLKLKRLVALKMILAGGHASPQTLARFRLEAEAVARLQHPNVVQIHEIGEHDGLPFFSLEFVDGGSLDKKLAGTPQAAEEAARLVEQLARAVHAAHQKDVVHRDLKPANVLLTANGEPKVTDFGLAKQLDDDSGQTQTGQVMGTPSYMSPEQAAGRVSDIGPLTDVWALGAILYEMLTGRPPFKGKNVRETLNQVCGREPVPPRKLAPESPRDLETICLKCLQKERQRRYASAEALADDLRRFQQGEPILARPVGEWARLWAWCRRNRSLATASTIAAGALGVVVTFIIVFAANLGKFRDTDADEARIRVQNAEAEAKQLRLRLDELERQAGQVSEDDLTALRRRIAELERSNAPAEEVQRLRERLQAIEPRTGAQLRLELIGGLQSSADEAYCWPTSDGNTLYFTREGTNADRPGTYRTHRVSQGATFGNQQFVCEQRHAVLTGDERYMVALGQGTPARLYQGLRSSATESFDTLTLIEELKDEDNPKSPWLSADGLTLVFQRRDRVGDYAGRRASGGQKTEFVVCHRNSLSNAWSAPQRLALRDDPLFTDALTWPALNDDGLKLFFCNGGGREPEVMYATRASANQPFSRPARVFVDGRPLLGRAPRYVASTRELFVTRDTGSGVPPSFDVWVVKNFVPTSEQQGWVQLFNGADLTGWRNAEQQLASWKVQDGTLHYIGKGGANLVSATNYKDFELWLEWKIAKGGDSGVYLRGVPQVQIWDNREGSGGLWNNSTGSPGKTPLVVADHPIGEWNTLYVKMVGARVTVYLNNKLVVNNALLEGQVPSEGPIELQIHGTPLWFRKVLIRELGRQTASGNVGQSGWVQLFNGTDLTGWKTHPNQPGGWTVANGNLIGNSLSAHHLFSERDDYENFHLRAEVRTARLGNSGVFFRSNYGVDRGGAFPMGYEAQILNSYHKPNSAWTGTLKHAREPDRSAIVSRTMVNDEEWFTLEVIAHGNHLTTKVNGTIGVDLLDRANTFRKGHIALQVMSDSRTTPSLVQFRKIEVKVLP